MAPVWGGDALMRYSSTGPPPLGAPHVTVADCSPADPTTLPGAPGAGLGSKELETNAGPGTSSRYGVIRTTYVVPFRRPLTMPLDEEPSTVTARSASQTEPKQGVSSK